MGDVFVATINTDEHSPQRRLRLKKVQLYSQGVLALGVTTECFYRSQKYRSFASCNLTDSQSTRPVVPSVHRPLVSIQSVLCCHFHLHTDEPVPHVSSLVAASMTTWRHWFATTCIGCVFPSASRSNSVCSSTRHCTAWLQSTSSRCVYQSRRPRQDHRCARRQGATSLFHALGSSSASAPSHSLVQQLGTVYLTIRSAESINTFKRLLKSFLFSVSYPGLSFSVTACYISSLY